MDLSDEKVGKIVSKAEIATDIVTGIGIGFVTKAAVTKMLLPLMPSVGAKILVNIGAAALAHNVCSANSRDTEEIGDLIKAVWALRNAIKEKKSE